MAEILELVTQVLFEGMHLVWIGNVKKALLANTEGKYKVRRLPSRKLDIIDLRMVQVQKHCPSDFNCKPDKIITIHNFKATELNQLALYTALAVLENVFPEDCYRHFLILHCVMRFLVSKATSQEILLFCQRALESYVILSEELYRPHFLSYNVHFFLHLVAHVHQFGDLESFSAFCYENSMPEFRKQMRKPDGCLQQYYNTRCTRPKASGW